jgi:hypothetical protein
MNMACDEDDDFNVVLDTTRFKPGDIICGRQERDRDLVRQIVDVRPTGYGWKYPKHGDITPSGVENYFISENSSDPELYWWVLKEDT